MSSPSSALDPRHVAARRVLLDALGSLAPQGSAVIVAGAQAVYLRTGNADLAVAPFTTDGDLAIDPSLLDDEPQLAHAMDTAGFVPSIEPGIWLARAVVDGAEVTIPVDLIVPEHAAPPGGRRGARLGVHGNRAARRARGLEAALVDHAPMTVVALEPDDPRSVVAEVAGEAALLVAKAHKLHDRVESGRADRLDDKDAADAVRLMRRTDPAAVAARLRTLFEDPIAGAVSADAVAMLDVLFGRSGRRGVQMATEALRLAMPAHEVEALCVSYTRELVRLTRAA